MDDYSDLEFVETRNAPNDRQRRTTLGGHSLGGGGGGGSFNSIGSMSGGGGGRTFTLQPRSQYGQAPYYPPPPGYGYPPPGFGVGFGVAPGSSLFGRMSTGQVIDMVAQIFAALMPLPAAPVATADAATDVGNLITYQSSITQYAKRDEQVRTLGNLIVKLVG